MTARLKFYYGPMDCGKSTLALQIHHNHTRSGRRGLLLTRQDRSGAPLITTRIGLTKEATELSDASDVRALASAYNADYVICDEVQFYPVTHVEQMADLVDCDGIDVYAFGLATDFRSVLFPATQRLLELSDEALRLQVEVLCWCGSEGQLNARVIDGRIARAGQQVVIGDTDSSAVHYQVLCRKHYRAGELGALAQIPAQAV